MDLTWQLAVGVAVEGVDVSGPFRRRLVSVTWTDAAGVDSDELEVVLADHTRFAPIEEPEPGVELELRLGARGDPVGTFVVDETEISDMPGTLTIRASGAALMQTRGGRSPMTTAKTRSWPAGTTLPSMAATIAGEHGLTPAVGRSLRDVVLGHVDQRAESDVSLLTRIAREHDALVKPTGRHLVVARRGEGRTASGASMPVIGLLRSEVSGWSRTRSEPAGSGKVVAVWRDRSAAADVEVEVGDGEPVRRLRHVYPDEAAARAAAESERARARRAKEALSFTMPGRVDMVAEALVRPVGWHASLAGGGLWAVTRAVHRVAGSWSVRVQAEPVTDRVGSEPAEG